MAWVRQGYGGQPSLLRFGLRDWLASRSCEAAEAGARGVFLTERVTHGRYYKILNVENHATHVLTQMGVECGGAARSTMLHPRFVSSLNLERDEGVLFPIPEAPPSRAIYSSSP
jgi:hypothetical protein